MLRDRGSTVTLARSDAAGCASDGTDDMARAAHPVKTDTQTEQDRLGALLI